mgnify:CR=1 FL=1
MYHFGPNHCQLVNNAGCGGDWSKKKINRLSSNKSHLDTLKLFGHMYGSAKIYAEFRYHTIFGKVKTYAVVTDNGIELYESSSKWDYDR